jgi:hypothetical protein
VRSRASEATRVRVKIVDNDGIMRREARPSESGVRRQAARCT